MRICASAIAILCSISSAFADPADYNRSIAFGDSLSDNGNLYNNTFGAAPLSPPYYQGRFSNGPTWIELLSSDISNPAHSTNPNSSMNSFWATPYFNTSPGAVDNGGTNLNVNAAIGGAETLNPGVIGQPSVYNQITTFIASGGTFGPKDIVSVQGGANDFLNGSTNYVGVATNEVVNIATIAGAGAKTILVSNLPNLGATPDLNTVNPTGGLLLTLGYNAVLNQGMQNLAAANPGVNFIQMDWYSALNVILAHPSAFGYTNTTDPCFNGTTVCATPNTYLFWDGVHPTETGQILLARYAALLLSTEETGEAVRALSQVALSNRLDASDIIFRRAADPAAQRPGGLYAEVIGSTATFSGTNTPTYGGTGYDYSLGGVRGGFDATEGRVSFGAALAYQTGSMSGHALSGDVSTTQIDAYALSRFGAFFTGFEGGVSFDQFDKLQRATGFPTVTAGGATQAKDYSFDVTLGAQYQLGGIALTPAARVGYASLNIEGFTENAPILALQYSNQDVTTGFWTARLRASSSLFGIPSATAWAEGGYEGLFGTSESYTAKLAANTAHAATLSDSLDGRGFFVKAGIAGYVLDGVKLSGEYELSTQNGAGDIQSGRMRITIPLHGDLHAGD